MPRNEKHPSTNFRYRSLAGEYCIEAEHMMDMGTEPFTSGSKQIKSIKDLISLDVADLQEVGKRLAHSKPPILTHFGKWELNCHACSP